MICLIKGFSKVNEADVFLEFSCFFYDPSDGGNLISGSSAFSKSSLSIWKFSVHILLKPSLENFEHYFASIWNKCNSVVVWTFFSLPLRLEWKLTFSSPVATAEFSKFDGILNNYKSIFHWLNQVPFFLNQQAKELQVHLPSPNRTRLCREEPRKTNQFKVLFPSVADTAIGKRIPEVSDTNMQNKIKSPKPGDPGVGRQSLFIPVLPQ